MTALAALAAALREDGGLMAAALADADGLPAELGAAAAAGPRAAGREEDYALLVEAIVEGYLQHYGTGRVVRPDDPDLALLAGDRLYALGLARLAELGDLAAVAELADVISLAAQAHAEGDPERARAIWQAGAAAVGHGTRPGARRRQGRRARRSAGRRRSASRRGGRTLTRGNASVPRCTQRRPCVDIVQRPHHGRRTQRAQEQVHPRPGHARRLRG